MTMCAVRSDILAEIMPLARIELPVGKPADYDRAVADVVYEAMIATLDAPKNDRFQVIAEHAREALIIDPTSVGLQVHCIMPIMQARAQPPTARKPLPRISPQLVADCEARNPSFGQQRLPQIALAPTAGPPPSRFAQADTDPVPTGDIKAPPASDETSVHLKPASGLDKVEANCSACHSLDYIPMNSPFLNAAGWDAEVSKMITAFGAPIDSKDAKAIADYLKGGYHPTWSDCRSFCGAGRRPRLPAHASASVSSLPSGNTLGDSALRFAFSAHSDSAAYWMMTRSPSAGFENTMVFMPPPALPPRG